MIEEHDEKKLRCRKLGHEVSFRYCRGGQCVPMCRSVLDCWWELFEVREFFKQNAPDLLVDIENTTPPSRMETIVDLIEKICKKSQKFVPDNARVAIMWLGSLTEAQAVLDCCSRLRRLYLVENRADRFEKFQGLPEVKQLLADSRVRIVHAGDGPAVLEPLFATDAMLFAEGKVGVYLSDEYCGMDPDFTDELRAFLLDHVRAAISASATRAVRGWHMMCNSVFNIGRLPFRNSLDSLNGLACGRPVVIVGAGPSLDGNVAELAESNVTIVACDSAWRTLDRNGIVPDIVVTTDGDEAAWRFFAGLAEKHPDVAIVNILRSSWTVGQYHRGLLLTGRAAGEESLERACAVKITVFDSGRCVGHAAFEIAKLLGADPVIMIGFDLGYSGERFHPRDMAVPYFQERPPEKENLISVPGIDGNPVLTDVSMLLYLREFERRIAEFKGVVFDATEGGALIRGARATSLRSVLACSGKPDIAGKLKSLRPDPEAAAAVSRDVNAGLLRLAGCAGELMAVVDEAGRDVAKFLSDGKEAFPALSPFNELLELVSGSYGFNVFAGFKLDWEDWIAAAAPRPAPLCLMESAMTYLGAVGAGARILREVILVSGRSADAKTVTAFSRGGSSETYYRLIETLRAAGYAVNEYRGDMDDIPEIWRFLRETRTGVALLSDGALYPAAWAMSGCACLDVRSSGVEQESLYSYWLPGYGVLCLDEETFRRCRDKVPPDRSVGFIKDDSTVCTGAAETSLDRYIKTLFDEVVAVRCGIAESG